MNECYSSYLKIVNLLIDFEELNDLVIVPRIQQLLEFLKGRASRAYPVECSPLHQLKLLALLCHVCHWPLPTGLDWPRSLH